MKKNFFVKMLSFLKNLRKAKIAYRLRHSRDDAIMVEINVPGERWEVEFLAEGTVEVERFQSSGGIHDDSELQELFAKYSDAELVNEHDAVARK